MASVTDSYCTPKWLTEKLGWFDLDPCSNSRSHVLAHRRYSLESGDDGLVLPWLGRVFMNHLYSDPLPWMRKLALERAMGRCTEAVVLAKLDCSTTWWAQLTAPAGDVADLWLFRRRIQFEPPPPGRGTSNNFCSAIVHRRSASTLILDLGDVATLWRITC